MIHVHKFKKFKFKNGTIAFRCVLCPTYVFQDNIIGYDCICWRCGETFKMTAKTMKLTKPHCDCNEKKQDMVLKKLLEKII